MTARAQTPKPVAQYDSKPNTVLSVSKPLDFRLVRATNSEGKITEFMVAAVDTQDGTPAVLVTATADQLRTATLAPGYVAEAVRKALGGNASSGPGPVSDGLVELDAPRATEEGAA
jgi:hypothetical protein